MVLTGFTFFKKAKIEGLRDNTAWISSTEKIFFLHSDKGKGIRDSLYSIQLGGENLVKLVDGPVNYYLIAPDGKKIAYFISGERGKNGCGYVDLNSNKNFIISNVCNSIDWNPFSNKLAYVLNEKEIHLFSLADLSSKELISIKKDTIVGPRWSKDGKNLYFNKLHSQTYHEIEVESGRMNEIVSTISAHSNDKNMMAKRKHWGEFIDLSKMHFNQHSETITSMGTSKLSPSKTKQLFTDKGSLILLEDSKKKKELIVRNAGGYNPDFGHAGFLNPTWTKDEKYVVGKFYGNIIVVELSSKTVGILTEGNAPLAYLPNYYPPISKIGNPMHYTFME